ncbi:MAG: sterol desaturase family protein [Gammaproteobacteria bacterium]|nr:sterol desaturase family protein [Gammaproteobacteria bacterium]MYD75449.1 sterol desaturase family protein [Gammaproteobacteria bacterium]MYJ51166.1 sterol desaturase family protein [Gammaproteobacteria bacterium]
MSESQTGRSEAYGPDAIQLPPLYAWPPKIVEAIRYITFDLLFPWGFIYLGIAVLFWHFLTPSMETMSEFSPGWMAAIWIRNALMLTAIAGGLHWWLYMRRHQAGRYKFDSRWQATGDRRFLWGDQVKDNMFWSLVSGVTIWTLYECVTLWFYASGRQPLLSVSDYPVYFAICVPLVLLWSTTHFYFVHRLLHVKPIYDIAHELHHRNVNIGPWAGISMHPLEHLLYFSLFVLWWFVPVHPIIVILTGLFQGASPSVTHSGFDYLDLGKGRKVTVGDYFHQLHHRHFHVNYGNTPTPFDKAFGSWHDGTEAGREVVKRRMRSKRTSIQSGSG